MRVLGTIAVFALIFAAGCNPADDPVGDPCPNAAQCSGSCVDTSNDAANCGECGVSSAWRVRARSHA